MGKIEVTIEKGADLFGAWAENIPGIYGEGNTVQETKDSILAAIELYKKYNNEIPAELQGDMDIDSILDFSLLLV